MDHNARILVLYLNTGGGHRGAARAMEAEIRRLYPAETPEIHLLDALPPGRSLQRLAIEQGYSLVSTTWPFIWPVLYETSKAPFLMRLQSEFMALHCLPWLMDYVKKHRINRIVNLHFLLNTTVKKLIHLMGEAIEMDLTVVLDPFTMHPYWAFDQSSPMVVFSDIVRKEAERQLRRLSRYAWRTGFLDQKILQLPPVVNHRFDIPLDPTLRLPILDQFGFDPHKPLILLAGGGEGLPQAEFYVAEICRQRLNVQVAVVCGRNAAQASAIEKVVLLAGGILIQGRTRLQKILPHPRRDGRSRTMVRVFGFVPYMYELMNIAGLVACKAGPATIFEVIRVGKPLVITQFLYGQEKGNVDFVRQNRLGWYAPKPRDLVKLLQRFLQDGTLPSANQKARSLVKNGSEALARLVVEGRKPHDPA